MDADSVRSGRWKLHVDDRRTNSDKSERALVQGKGIAVALVVGAAFDVSDPRMQ
jgi:hypothetical protein